MVDYVDWIGVSGTKYTFAIYRRHPRIKGGQMGNYIYAKVVNNVWVPIYIGQGDLSVRCTKRHHQIECINSKGATHVHLKLTGDDDIRKSRERDLLTGHPNAYAPVGCNQ